MGLYTAIKKPLKRMRRKNSLYGKLPSCIIKVKTTATKTEYTMWLCDYLCEIKANTHAGRCITYTDICVWRLHTHIHIHKHTSCPFPKKLLEGDYSGWLWRFSLLIWCLSKQSYFSDLIPFITFIKFIVLNFYTGYLVSWWGFLLP